MFTLRSPGPEIAQFYLEFNAIIILNFNYYLPHILCGVTQV